MIASDRRRLGGLVLGAFLGGFGGGGRTLPSKRSNVVVGLS
jgi:hypothetical protein